MANFLQQLRLGGTTYDFYDSEFIIDNRSAAGAALTGVSKASILFDGMQITYWLNKAAGENATLNLTLASGTTTGAIPCYYSGTTRLGTEYEPGNTIRFTYRENVTIGATTIAAGWWSDANYTVSDSIFVMDGDLVFIEDSQDIDYVSTITTWADFMAAINENKRIILNVPWQLQDETTTNLIIDLQPKLLNLLDYDNNPAVLLSGTVPLAYSSYINDNEVWIMNIIAWSADGMAYFKMGGSSSRINRASRADYADEATDFAGSYNTRQHDGRYILKSNGYDLSWDSEVKIVNFSLSGFTLTCTDGTTLENIQGFLNEQSRFMALIDNSIYVNIQGYQIYSEGVRSYAILSHPNTILQPSVYAVNFTTVNTTLVGIIISVDANTDTLPVIGFDTAGTAPTLSYTPTTSSKATLSNGLLSFTDTSASNISNWSAGNMPTLEYGSVPYVGTIINNT